MGCNFNNEAWVRMMTLRLVEYKIFVSRLSNQREHGTYERFHKQINASWVNGGILLEFYAIIEYLLDWKVNSIK